MSEITNEVPIQPATNANNEKPASINLKEFIFKYLRYLPWVVLSGLIGLVAAYLKIRYTVPVYHVQSSMLIKNEGGGGMRDPRFDELFMSPGNSNLNNEIQILRSRPVLERVARNLGLQRVYYVKGSIRSTLQYADNPVELQIYKLVDSVTGFGFKATIINDNQFLLDEGKTPIVFGQPFKVGENLCALVRIPGGVIRPIPRIFLCNWQPLLSAAEGLQDGLKVVQASEQTTILNLSFDGVDTKLGVDVLNNLMSVYDSLIVEDKTRIASITLRFIDDRLLNLKDELGGVQGNMKNFMINNQAYDVSTQSKTYLDNLNGTAKEKATQEVKMNVLNWLLEYIQDSKNRYNIVPVDLGIAEPALLQLINNYNQMQLTRDADLKTTTPDNPLIISMDSTLEKVRYGISQALTNVRQSYVIEGENLRKQEEKLQGNIQSIPGKSMQLLDISRQQKILEELYSFLLQKKLETAISSASTISNSKVIEPALESSIAIEPNRKKVYTMYLLVGLLVPIGVVALMEILRDKVRNRADVEKYTHAPILGEIGHSNQSETLVATMNNRHFISEQFRIVRTNLQYVLNKVEKPVIMVTSSFSGEGKSFVSTNVAAVMALTGKRTVIMEFDIRKPKIVSGLDLKRKMGITNYIIGKASFQELLVKVDGVDNLFVIPCGPIPPNPAEILLDPMLEKLMNEVRRNFDVVVMDTAPVGLVSDAMNLSRYADCTLYIIRQGHTFRKQLSMVEDLYVNRKLPRLSLMLNDVQAEGNYYGGYGYGYYGSYSYGADSGYFDADKNGRGRFLSRLFKPSRKK
ncbi:GumC family protein [Puia dinghuensis]|uniref:Tyrosine protein kinase n=1 Tax=Puia dinghuensis TaxID=1792502 RepID=A0A8J2UF02_9BACT|nr:polysaccharide biosynthesis tyrosine autokinase [Puia dinghuensis]GGB08666.1 tyrosine protein kinase [Puia dinghuensis]